MNPRINPQNDQKISTIKLVKKKKNNQKTFQKALTVTIKLLHLRFELLQMIDPLVMLVAASYREPEQQ